MLSMGYNPRNESSRPPDLQSSLHQITSITTLTNTDNHSLMCPKMPGAKYLRLTSHRIPTLDQNWRTVQTIPDPQSPKQKGTFTQTSSLRSSPTLIPTLTRPSTRQPSLILARSNHPPLPTTSQGTDKATCNNSKWNTCIFTGILKHTITEVHISRTPHGMEVSRRRPMLERMRELEESRRLRFGVIVGVT